MGEWVWKISLIDVYILLLLLLNFLKNWLSNWDIVEKMLFYGIFFSLRWILLSKHTEVVLKNKYVNILHWKACIAILYLDLTPVGQWGPTVMHADVHPRCSSLSQGKVSFEPGKNWTECQKSNYNSLESQTYIN